MNHRVLVLPAMLLLGAGFPRHADSLPSDQTDNHLGKPAGIVIESVGKGSALEHAGLQPGDVLYRWRRRPNPPANPEPASGVFERPLDWWYVEVEQSTSRRRGAVWDY